MKAEGEMNGIAEYLAKIDEVIKNGEFKDDWQSLSAHRTPDWYRKGRFGIFIHWGVYSVPAFGNEWYPRRMYDKFDPVCLYHKAKYGSDFDYRRFIDMFDPAEYDADEWARIFADAGAKFVMPVCEHHDGIKMYASSLNRWNMYDLKGRDYITELKEALQKRGLEFLASNHRAEHYWFMNFARRNFPESEVAATEEYRDLYGPAYLPPSGNAGKTDKEITAGRDWLEDWLASSCEMIDRLQPSAVYFDWWIQKREFKPYLKKFLAYYYNRGKEWGKQVTVFYKVGAVMKGAATFDVERGQVDGIRSDVWQNDTSTARNSWCHTSVNVYKSPVEILCNMIEVVSKNGCFMLNVGPKADGTICDKEKEILSYIGTWMKANGEAIYDCEPCEVGFGEGKKRRQGSFFERMKFGAKDYRFTFRTGAIYVFPVQAKSRKKFRIKKLAFSGEHGIRYDIKSVELLGSDAKVMFSQDEKALTICLGEIPNVPLPYCFKITVD